MAAREKSMNLFLMDGAATGRVKCTLASWTGVAYKIPCTDLDKCREGEDLSQSGVYFLFTTSEQTDETVVYVGQAGARNTAEGTENIRRRKDAILDSVTEDTNKNSLTDRMLQALCEPQEMLILPGETPDTRRVFIIDEEQWD